ncbi:MAG: hypothetical protein COV74_05500 [Candidatus Omnitrophica bacterium CG11_big_fil_rev_8_21_14_0_20_45_26]|uniref:Uncharacterized protein n=1 Tax=Candidatus Abzuiibacterium crystallinum TaxID=1974748 RepID=A0A2H0LPP0_9BACT|nr:MAG: hypothetical protein COV74_05500 [Candidatus Omnitrophica bacterium CG11_big_fil_rev_8_21_14_0_20_45_26]PIW64346.1 MAG: hypothetical protein COW12_06820 [Candidatus Omnitrophica bacterium CG12_big_fil_rev_8_21_14_0_65_45_16]
MKRILPAIIALSIVFNGCAQYKRPPLLIKVPEYYQNYSQAEELSVAVEPYFKEEKAVYLFNNHPLKKGILPILLIAFNYGDHAYDMSKVTISIIRDDGFEYQPMVPKRVAREVLKNTPLRMIGWGFAGLIVLSIPLSMMAGIDSYRANKNTKDAVLNESMKVNRIDPKEVVDGFYFFRIADKSREVKEISQHQYQIKITGVVNQSTLKTYEFVLGLN